MYINDKRRNPTTTFSHLDQGDLFAYTEGGDTFYLMVADEGDCDYGRAVVLGAKEGDTSLAGRIWKFDENDEVEPLHGSLEVWAK